VVGLYEFPRGLNGVALTLLRISLATLLCIEARCELIFSSPSVFAFLVVALGILLFAGFFTRYVCCAAPLAVVYGCLMGIEQPALSSMAIIGLCLATAILGAGEYSLDALFFGRRRVVL
jgi:uncharacterized membrane protein YphA (DoxX/SURF4 family)